RGSWRRAPFGWVRRSGQGGRETAARARAGRSPAGFPVLRRRAPCPVRPPPPPTRRARWPRRARPEPAATPGWRHAPTAAQRRAPAREAVRARRRGPTSRRGLLLSRRLERSLGRWASLETAAARDRLCRRPPRC